MSNGLYLYGIVTDNLPNENLDLIGIDQQPVSMKEWQNFTFIYSEAKQKKYLTSRRNLLTHEKVLEDIMNMGLRNLLPLQFGLVIKDWEQITNQLIIPYAEKLNILLAKLEGKREVSIKVFWLQNAELQSLLEEKPELKKQRDSLQGKTLSMDEIINIGQNLEEGLTERKQIIIDTFRQELNPLATEIIEGENMTEDMIYNSAYLIEWSAEKLFSEIVENIDKRFSDRLRIRYNNFTAPYTFCQLN